jgi:hypothetical protein
VNSNVNPIAAEKIETYENLVGAAASSRNAAGMDLFS